MSRNQHIMYASSSHIEQIFHERYGGVSQMDFGTSEELSSTVEGKLSALVGSLRGNLSGGVTRSEIKKINFEDEMFQTKQVINDLLNDDSIPSVTELYGSDGNWEGMYRFSSEVLLQPHEDKFDDNKNFLKVTGIEDNVKFHGITSLDNWGSRSNLLSAMEVDRPYPFQGVLTPVEEEFSGIEQVEYRVQFLFICTPDKESLKRWRK